MLTLRCLTTSGSRRLLLLAAAGLLALPVAGGESPAAETPAPLPATTIATDFAATLAARLTAFLNDAGALDPASGEDLASVRRTRQRRLAELEDWHDRQQALARDRAFRAADAPAKLQEYRQLRGASEFLELPARQRREFVRQVTTYLAGFRAQFGPTLSEFVSPAPSADGGSPAMPASIAEHLARAPQFAGRYFPRAQGSQTYALRLPFSEAILLNLSAMQRDPRGFFGSLEHELWHHLLPIISPGHGADNLWYEGFTEALAQAWGEELHRRLPAGQQYRPPTVEYPVLVAWCSLYLAADRPLTIACLAGSITDAQFTTRLTATETAAAPLPLRRFLAETWRQRLALARERQARAAQLLTSWGWHEDDGTPLTLARYAADGKLVPAALDQDFVADRRFFTDLAEALAVLALQDLVRAGAAPAPESLALPPQLQNNLRLVLVYTRAPRLQYAVYAARLADEH